MTRTLRLTTFSRPSLVLAAQYEGFFEREGLVVEIDDASGSRAQMDGLLRGDWDIAHTNADNILRYRAAGSGDLELVAVLSTGIAQKLVVAPEINDWSDLHGRTVGVDAVDSGFALVAYDLLRRAGLERPAYDVAALGSTKHRVEGLLTGKISAAMVGHHHEAIALEAGCRILAETGAAFGGHPGISIAAVSTWARSQESELVSYLTAMFSASAWTFDPEHRDEVIDLIARERRVDPEQAARLLATESAGRTSAITSTSDAATALAQTASLRERFTGVRSVDYFNPAFMEQALAAIRTS